MTADYITFIDCALAMLALMNPISKMFIITTLPTDFDQHQVRHLAVKSSLIALVILLSFTFVGHFLLNTIFHVQIYAFKIAGGTVLLLRGFMALNKGLFFEHEKCTGLEEMSVVPLASPMIAGPATITASVSFPARYGYTATITAIIASVLLTLGVMLSARLIGNVLIKYNFMGALIRITGLIVATIGVQMLCDGMSDYLRQVILNPQTHASVLCYSA